MKISIHKPARPINVTIALTGSKSISNRILVIRAISQLEFDIHNLSDSEDTRLLQHALDQVAQPGNREINVNHAGTDFRFLTSLLSITAGTHFLTGSGRLKQRPVGELVKVLQQLGADISYEEKEGFPPLRISGQTITGGKASIRGNISSQFISALLLVSPYFEQGLALEITTALVSRPYVDMTVSLMRQFGIDVTWHDNTLIVKPGKYAYQAAAYDVEGDWSSASYWYSIAALSAECDITLQNLSGQSLQADSVAETIYKSFGVDTSFSVKPDGRSQLTLRKKGPVKEKHFSYDFTDCPDIAQTLACTCAGLNMDAKLEGLQTLKIKETDRIEALKQELEKFGVTVTTSPNNLVIQSREQFQPGSLVKTYHDHRMAMGFAPLCLVKGDVMIDDDAVVNKSYPGFWKDLEQAGFTIKQLP